MFNNVFNNTCLNTNLLKVNFFYCIYENYENTKRNKYGTWMAQWTKERILWMTWILEQSSDDWSVQLIDFFLLQHCKRFRVGVQCCDFLCLDDIEANWTGPDVIDIPVVYSAAEQVDFKRFLIVFVALIILHLIF